MLPGADVVLLVCSILIALYERCIVESEMDMADKHVGCSIKKDGGDGAAN